jgi:hypothetical protein
MKNNINIKKLNHKNIFIVHSPYQLYLSKILALKELNNSADNFLVLEGYDYKLDDTSMFKKVFNITKTNGRWFGYNFRKKIISEIDCIMNAIEIQHIDYLFLSDIAWPLNNYVFTKFVLHKRQIKLNFFEDGIANYVNSHIDFLTIVKMSLKKIFGHLKLALPSSIFKGHILGCDHELVEKIYGLDTNLLKCSPNKKRKIYVPKNKVESKLNETVIILDQPYVKFFGEYLVKRSARKVEKFLLDNGIDSILIKHHPRDISGTKSFAQYINNVEKKIINSYKIAEELIPIYNCKLAISFNSTSLINIKHIYNIRCYGVFINFDNKKSSKYNINYTQTISFLKKNGIKIL